MLGAAFTPLDWLAVVHRELLLFSCLFFALGSLDEFAIDILYLVGRLSGRIQTPVIDRQDVEGRDLSGPVAVIVPAWHEEEVIGATMRHLLTAWPQEQVRLYVGCYANDPATIEAAARAARGRARARIVIHSGPGPTTKADCMNRVYRAIEEDERREDIRFRMVVIHDAEDMVDPAALPLFDAAIAKAELLQIPVLPSPQAPSRWVSGHYMDEFAEAHAKGHFESTQDTLAFGGDVGASAATQLAAEGTIEGETANGSFPKGAVEIMARTCMQAEHLQV